MKNDLEVCQIIKKIIWHNRNDYWLNKKDSAKHTKSKLGEIENRWRPQKS